MKSPIMLQICLSLVAVCTTVNFDDLKDIEMQADGTINEISKAGQGNHYNLQAGSSSRVQTHEVVKKLRRTRMQVGEMALQGPDWDVVLMSVGLLEDYQQKLEPVNLDETSHRSFQITQKVIEELNECHRYLKIIFKFIPQATSRKFSSSQNLLINHIPKDIREPYTYGLCVLLQLLQQADHLEGPLLSMESFRNQCIFRTLSYVKKHNLLPEDIWYRIQHGLSTPSTLSWLVDELVDTFVSASPWTNRHDGLIPNEDFVANDFSLSHYGHMLEVMSQKEKHLFLFYCVEAYSGDPLAEKFPGKTRETMQLLQDWDSHLKIFMDKFKKILLSDFGIGADETPGGKESLWALKEDILKCRNFVRNPDLGPDDSLFQLNVTVRRSFFLLELIEKKYGPEYVASLEYEETNESAAEFQRNFEWIRVDTAVQSWRHLFRYYKRFIAMAKLTHREVPRELRKKMGKFYWRKFKLKAFSLYTLLQEYSSNYPLWWERVQTNTFYRHLNEDFVQLWKSRPAKTIKKVKAGLREEVNLSNRN